MKCLDIVSHLVVLEGSFRRKVFFTGGVVFVVCTRFVAVAVVAAPGFGASATVLPPELLLERLRALTSLWSHGAIMTSVFRSITRFLNMNTWMRFTAMKLKPVKFEWLFSLLIVCNLSGCMSERLLSEFLVLERRFL